MTLTPDNYFSLPADRAYFSVHQVAAFCECAARETTRLHGKPRNTVKPAMNEQKSPNAKAGLTYRCNHSIGCPHARECPHAVAHRPIRVAGLSCNRKGPCEYDQTLIVRCRQWWKERARRNRHFAEVANTESEALT